MNNNCQCAACKRLKMLDDKAHEKYLIELESSIKTLTPQQIQQINDEFDFLISEMG